MAIINTPFDEQKFDENGKYIPEAPQPPQAPPEQPEQGLTLDPPTPEEGPVQEQQEPSQEQPAQQLDPSEVNNFDLGDAAMAVPLGAVDFAADAAGFVGFKAADKWWDENSPRNNNPWVKGIRDLSAIVIPTLIWRKNC